jgi:vacuolar-type H+-ATPase subunit F/Vma7
MVLKLKGVKIMNINNKNDTKEKNEILDGAFRNIDYISPTCVNKSNPKFLEINDIKYGGLLIVNYNREYHELILKNLIETNVNVNISIFYEKKNTNKAIKELTYYIGHTGADIKDNYNKNREDINLIAFTHNDAEYIRKEIQINNEELYNIYIYVEIYSKEEKELEYLLNKVEGMAQSKGMRYKKSIF